MSDKSRLATDQVGSRRYSNLSRSMKQSVSGVGMGSTGQKTVPFMRPKGQNGLISNIDKIESHLHCWFP